MGTEREQSQGEVLPADRGGTEAAARGDGKEEPHWRCQWRDCERSSGGSMRLLRRIATWWKAVSRSEELNAEIEDELAFHIDAYAADLIGRGVPREEAYRRGAAGVCGVGGAEE